MEKINTLVTGSNGQLGNEIRKIAADYPDYHFHFTDVAELDITNSEAVEAYVKANSIHCIINAAAYTAVDKAESEPEPANKINGYAVGNLAAAAENAGALLIHISTDYVFDGTSHRPIYEDHKPAPLSAYAQSKLIGESELLAKCSKGVTIS